MKCPYCPTEFEPRQWNQIHCKSPECEKKHQNEYWKANHSRWPTHNPKPRVCKCGCGRDLARTRFHEYSPASECREAMRVAKLEERKKPKPEEVFRGSERICRWKGCKESTGANYFYCHKHAQLLDKYYSEDAVGFSDSPADVFL